MAFRGTDPESCITEYALVYEDKWAHLGAVGWRMAGRSALTSVACFETWRLGFRAWGLWGYRVTSPIRNHAPP